MARQAGGWVAISRGRTTTPVTGRTRWLTTETARGWRGLCNLPGRLMSVGRGLRLWKLPGWLASARRELGLCNLPGRLISVGRGLRLWKLPGWLASARRGPGLCRLPGRPASAGRERGLCRLPGRLVAGVRGWALWELPGWLACFVLGVVTADAAAIGVAADPARLDGGQAGLFALLLGLSIVSVELTRRSGEPAGVIKDVHGVWELTIAVFLPPVCAFVAPIPRLAITQWRTRKTLAHRRVFTAAATGLSYGCASVIYHTLASRAGWLSPGPGTPRWLAWIAVVAACGLCQQAINLSLVVTAVKGSDPGASARELAFARESLFNDGAELVTTVVTAVLTAVGSVLAVLALPLVILLHRSHRHAQLVAASRVDPKTGLLNAAAWQREARVQLTRASRTGAPAAVAMLDIDHFKVINDRHGHLAGDAVLVALAAAMPGLLRDYDLIGRFGGEEFCVLLPHTTAAEAARAADRLRRKLAQLAIPAGGQDSAPLHLTVSIGVATLDPAHRDLDDLVAEADAALYRAKAAGRNRVAVSGVDSAPQARGEAAPDAPGAGTAEPHRPKTVGESPEVGTTEEFVRH